MEEVKLKLSVDGYAPVSVNADAFDAKSSSVDIVRENGREYAVSIKFEKAPKGLCGEIVKCDVPHSVTELRLPDSIKSITTPLDWLVIDKKEDISLHKSLLTADGNLIVCNNKVLRQIGKESEISIPEGITVIGEGAFMNKKDLTKVEFSKTIETIEAKAFSGCSSLPVKFPRNLKTIGDYAYEGCGRAGKGKGLRE